MNLKKNKRDIWGVRRKKGKMLQLNHNLKKKKVLLITRFQDAEIPGLHRQPEQYLLTCRNPIACSGSDKDDILPIDEQYRNILYYKEFYLIK